MAHFARKSAICPHRTEEYGSFAVCGFRTNGTHVRVTHTNIAAKTQKKET